VGLAAIRLEADWQLALLEVTAGEPPPSWRRQRWAYERAVFVASQPAGATVAKWLERERISLPSLSIKVPLDGSVDLERRDSNFQGIYERLQWPTREWKVYARNTSGQMLHDELVGVATPAARSRSGVRRLGPEGSRVEQRFGPATGALGQPERRCVAVAPYKMIRAGFCARTIADAACAWTR
jgi:hypothetical protein